MRVASAPAEGDHRMRASSFRARGHNGLEMLVRRLAIVLAVLYCVVTGLSSLLKATTTLFSFVPWSEMFFGPALTCASVFLIAMFAAGIERRIRG